MTREVETRFTVPIIGRGEEETVNMLPTGTQFILHAEHNTITSKQGNHERLTLCGARSGFVAPRDRPDIATCEDCQAVLVAQRLRTK